MRSTKTRLADALVRLVNVVWPPGPPRPVYYVEDVDVRVGCRCSCGSQVLHQVTLVSTADCPRCGRTIGIQSFVYYRRGPGTLPDPRVTVGEVFEEGRPTPRGGSSN